MSRYEDQFIQDVRMRRVQDSIGERDRAHSRGISSLQGQVSALEGGVFVGAKLLEGVALSTGGSTVRHELGRMPRGAIIVLSNGPRIVTSITVATQGDKAEAIFATDVSGTCSMVVF